MISKFLEIIGLTEKLPEPIGYSISEPIWFPLPDEIDVDNEVDDFAIISFRIYNLSDKELDNVRILYNGDYTYLPKLHFKRRDIDVEYNVDIIKKEFIINTIPPKDDLIIHFFIKENEKIEIEEVLIDKIRINQYMQKYTQMKRYPLLLFVYILTFISIVGTGYTVFKISDAFEKREILDNVVNKYRKNWKSYNLYIFDNKIENEKLLFRKFNQLTKYEQDEVLKINEVDTYEKLKVKDEVYLLEKP